MNPGSSTRIFFYLINNNPQMLTVRLLMVGEE
jgi:hypothetical protein